MPLAHTSRSHISLIAPWRLGSSSPFEKMAANLAAENLERERAGKAKATSTIDADFWAKLGGEGPIKSKEEAGEVLPTMAPVGEGVLFKLSDATGTVRLRRMQRARARSAWRTPSKARTHTHMRARSMCAHVKPR